jgi:hypothetical protein
LVIVGLLAGAGLVVGWVGVSGTVRLDTQAGWLGLGIASMLLGTLGMVGWLVIGLAAVTRLRRTVIEDLTARSVRREAAHPAQVEAADGDRLFGITAGMRRYHRAECELLAGKEPRWLDEQALVFAGTRPCGICRPDAIEASQ